ncbi:MAG TPA: alpha/beta hydrolase, partial [Anaerolineales bacterium]
VYLMGHSMGGSRAYEVGLHYPDRFSGLMPIDATMGDRVGQTRPAPAWIGTHARPGAPVQRRGGHRGGCLRSSAAR